MEVDTPVEMEVSVQPAKEKKILKNESDRLVVKVGFFLKKHPR